MAIIKEEGVTHIIFGDYTTHVFTGVDESFIAFDELSRPYPAGLTREESDHEVALNKAKGRVAPQVIMHFKDIEALDTVIRNLSFLRAGLVERENEGARDIM